MKFKIGDKVKIRKYSEYYRTDDDLNPVDTMGEIIDLYSKLFLPIAVRWVTGAINSYEETDLEYWGYPINELNKLLYPDYVEINGLLVPKSEG